MQTATMQARCEAGVYGPCSPELREDLEDMTRGACLIDAIAQKSDGEHCTEKAPSK